MIATTVERATATDRVADVRFRFGGLSVTGHFLRVACTVHGVMRIVDRGVQQHRRVAGRRLRLGNSERQQSTEQGEEPFLLEKSAPRTPWQIGKMAE